MLGPVLSITIFLAEDKLNASSKLSVPEIVLPAASDKDELVEKIKLVTFKSSLFTPAPMV